MNTANTDTHVICNMLDCKTRLSLITIWWIASVWWSVVADFFGTQLLIIIKALIAVLEIFTEEYEGESSQSVFTNIIDFLGVHSFCVKVFDNSSDSFFVNFFFRLSSPYTYQNCVICMIYTAEKSDLVDNYKTLYYGCVPKQISTNRFFLGEAGVSDTGNFLKCPRNCKCLEINVDWLVIPFTCKCGIWYSSR